MKKYNFRTACFLGLLLLPVLLSGMGGKPDAPPETDVPTSAAANAHPDRDESGEEPFAAITSINITDRDVLAGKKPLIVTFSDPMVEAGDVDKPVPYESMPFSLTPRIAGEGRWLTDKSFAFAAANVFPPGQQYRLMFKDSLKSLAGRTARYVFSFRTESPKLQNVEVGRYDAAKFTQELYLEFSIPVKLDALREHLSVTDAESGESLPVAYSAAKTEIRSLHLGVELGRHRPRIVLTLRGDAASDTHPLGLAAERKIGLRLPERGSEISLPTIEAIASEPSPVTLDGAHFYDDEQGNLVARFSLSAYLASQSHKEFISVNPDLPYTLSEYGDALLFRDGVEPGLEMTVTLKPGLTDSAGRALREARSRTLVIGNREPAVRFAEPGNFLTPVFGSRVALTVVNADQVVATLRRQYDNNLPFMALEPEDHAKNMMRELAVSEIPLKNGKLNDVQRRSLDLEDLARGRKGVFLLTLRAYHQETDSRGRSFLSYANEQERMVVLTDIGVTARVFSAGITVFASGISTAQGLPDAEVTVYSRSNQIIAGGHTGADGVFIHKREKAWEPQLLPGIVTVKSGVGEQADITFLPISYETGVEQADPAMREYLQSGYEAFVYTPRGVFRPGERVDVKAFVRDPEHKPPSPFPVLFRLISSRGLEMAKDSVTLSQEGGADFAFTLPAGAPTGNYMARLEIPGQKNRFIGSCRFSVEDFSPPRLEVEVAPETKRLEADKKLKVRLSGRYLFGAPGSGLSYELGYRITEKAFTPEGWSGYVFGDAEREFVSSVNLRYLSGQLTDSGQAEEDFAAPPDWQAPALLDVQLIGSVQEDGGRWVTRTDSFTYFPTAYLLGLQVPGRDLAPGKAARIQVAAVNPDGQAADSGSLLAETFFIQSNWHTVHRNGRYVYTLDERFIPRDRQILSGKDGRAELSFTPNQHGAYLVRVSSEDGTVTASLRLSVASGEERDTGDGSGRTDRVELAFDKPAYFAGETARLSVKAPYAGTLFLGLERAEQISTRIIAMEQPATVVDIPVTQDMDPNINVTAWVIRPVREENREWYAHRAHGLIALSLSKEPHTLKVSALAPERALPNATLGVPFMVTDEQGTPVEGEFSAALVDEGILSLTGFETPQPADFFMAKRRATGKTYDAFDALLRPEARATPLLRPGGGSSGDEYYGSLSTQQVFLAGYVPVVRTDANGQGEAVFDVPEYSGKGRLMIVGASHDRFGMFDCPVPIARDIVVESSSPRSVAPGDSFEIFLQLFTRSGVMLEGNADVRVSAEGPLVFAGNTELSLPLSHPPAGEPATREAAIPAKAARKEGIARITVRVSVPGREDLSFSKDFEIAVRTPYPRMGAMESALVKAGERKEFSVPGSWLPGSVKPVFVVDKSPVLAVLPALEFLMEYPYGCLEQVTSRAWPYLTLASVRQILYPGQSAEAFANNTKTALADAVVRILSMQLPDGGFGLWPGYTASAPWVSVNATFFLVEARSRTPVSSEALERALGYLRAILANPAPASSEGAELAHIYTTKAFAAFVLTRAGDPPLGWLQSLSEQEHLMLPSGRLFLAGAKALKAGNPNALKALQEKDLALKQEEMGLNASKEGALRNQSLRLYLWTLVAPGDAAAAQLSLDVASRLGNARHHTTQDAGMASLALGSYLEKTGSQADAEYKAGISMNGTLLGTAETGQRLILGSDHLPLDDKGSLQPVSIEVKGSGQAYCVYSARGVPASAPEPVSSGLFVQRRWKNAQGEAIDPASGAIRLKKGDRVFVELILAADRPLADVVLSDLLPGGMEVENPRLNATGTTDSDRGQEDASDNEADRTGIFFDLREDRVLLFFEAVGNSPVVHSYSLRAVSRGAYLLPPLAAEAMYAPAVNAVTATGLVIVE